MTKPIKWDLYKREGEGEDEEVVLIYKGKEVARYEIDFIVEEGLQGLEDYDEPEIIYTQN